MELLPSWLGFAQPVIKHTYDTGLQDWYDTHLHFVGHREKRQKGKKMQPILFMHPKH